MRMALGQSRANGRQRISKIAAQRASREESQGSFPPPKRPSVATSITLPTSLPGSSKHPPLPSIDDAAESDEDDEVPIFSGSYVPDVPLSPVEGLREEEKEEEEEAIEPRVCVENSEQKRIAEMQAIVDASREAAGRRPVHGDRHALTKEEAAAFGRARALWDGKRRRGDMLEVARSHKLEGSVGECRRFDTAIALLAGDSAARGAFM